MKEASKSRRQLLQAGSAASAMALLGLPAIVKAQSDKIRIGHLTPLTGFLGPLWLQPSKCRRCLRCSRRAARGG